MTYVPSVSMYMCTECKGCPPCYCIRETVFTPFLCVDERGPDGAKWKPLPANEARAILASLNIQTNKFYEPPEEDE